MVNAPAPEVSKPAPEEIAARLAEPLPVPIRWKHDGDQFIGTYVRLEKGPTPYGEKWIMVLADANGELHALWLLQRVLIEKLKRLRPSPGDVVGVKYLGKRGDGTTKSPRYADFRVVSGAHLTGYSWDDLDSDGEDIDPTGGR